MKKFNLFLIFFMTTSRLVLGQMDINAVNKPVELLNSANEDIPYKPYRTGKIRYCGLLRNNYQPAISGFKSSTMAREFLQI